MIALARVDLPEPLGPIRAWISPLLDGQIQAAQDLLLAGADVKVSDL